MNFKVGDKVRILDVEDKSTIECLLRGAEGVVESVLPEEIYPIGVSVNGALAIFLESELEIVK